MICSSSSAPVSATVWLERSPSFAENAKILQIDVDPAEVNKNVMVDASIIGDVKEVLKRTASEAG